MVAAALLVHGCAGPAASPPRPPGPAVRAGRPGFVVAAPRDPAATGEIAAEIARRTGFGLVLAPTPTDRARQIDERGLHEAAQGPLRFYAEIHRGGSRPCAGRLAIGTVGVDAEGARRLRALAELIRDAHLRGNPDVQRLDVSVAPAEPASALPGEVAQALEIELPRCARQDFRETYTAVLADFLTQAVLLRRVR